MSFNDLERGLSSSPTSGGRGMRSSPLAQRGLPFPDEQDNGGREFLKLKGQVSRQVGHIVNNVAKIRRIVGQLGTAKDTSETRTELHNLTEETRDLVKNTGDDLRTLNHLGDAVQEEQRRQRRPEQQKLGKDFQEALRDFQEIQRLSVQKQREYVGKAKALSVHGDQYDDEDVGGVGPTESQPLLGDHQQRLQLQVVSNEIEYNESLIEEREVEIREIERGIRELNEIFVDLGTLVTEQQSNLDHIESYVVNTLSNVKSAASELVEASNSQRKARKLKCCLLLIIVIVMCVFLLVALL